MIVLDASVLIATLDVRDPLHGRAQELLAERVDEDRLLHVLTRAEVLVAPLREGQLELVERRLEDLELKTVDLLGSNAGSLARVRVRSQLKLPDCCVLFCAEQHDAAVATFDQRLAREGRAMGLRVLD